MDGAVEKKRLLRAELRARLAAMSEEKKRCESDKIAAWVETLALPDGGICIYNSLNCEVDTKKLIDYFIGRRDVYLPVVDGEGMLLVQVDADTEYESAGWGILEPKGKRLAPSEVDAAVTLTPLLGADKRLARLGKGKGYYDRYFAETDTLKIGLAFSDQIVDEVPCEPTDIPLDMLITADGVIRRQ